QSPGGNDALNPVIPFNDPDSAKLRPTLKIPASQVKKVNDSIGLHPSMTGMAELLQEQALCIVQGVGYPNPSQSHFRSMDIWQGASTDETITEGWIGKTLKTIPQTPSFHLAATNETAPLALSGAPIRIPSLTSLADFQLRTIDGKDQRAIIEGTGESTKTGS